MVDNVLVSLEVSNVSNAFTSWATIGC